MSSLPPGRRGAGRRPRNVKRRPTVESLEAKALLATFTVTSNADAGAGTLRRAINDANDSAGLDQIRFALPAGQTTITLGSQLPAISDPVNIDGTTQAGYQGVPIVEVTGGTGTQTGAGDGFVITGAGGGSTIRGLLITRFSGNGITMIGGGNNRIQNNYIGVASDGVSDSGNDGHGVFIQSSNGNIVGGDPTRSNTIFHNGRDTTFNGITVVGGAQTSINNRFLYNAIAFSGGLGIDLGNDGVTPNDPVPDGDFGPNLQQNFPVIDLAVRIEPLFDPPSSQISGSLRSRPNTTYVIEYFESTGADQSGNGEGEQPLFVRQVSTDANGLATFNDFPSRLLTAGSFLTATATDPDGNTSEFSPAKQIELRSDRVDLGILGVTDAPDPVEAGQVLTYVVQVANFTFGTASGPAELQIRLPQSVLPVLPLPPNIVQDPADPTLLRASLGQLQGGAVSPVTLQVIPSQAGIIQTTFSVTGGISDPNAQNDRAAAVTQVTLNPSSSIASFRVRDYSINEAGNLATIEVVRTNSAAGALAVDYATADGSAIAGTHYQPVTGTLVFGNNELTKTFTVPILDNGTIDPNRTVNLLLSNPRRTDDPAGSAIIGVPARATLTIFDDDPVPAPPQFLAFASAQNTVLENQGQATVLVRRSGGSTGVVSIPFATVAGTALPGRDFVATSGTLTFASGELEKSIVVPIADNAAVDGNRAFTITLGEGTGVAPGDIRSTQVTIVDDESPPLGSFQFSAAGYSAVESAGAATITVTRSGGSGPATITYAATAGTAEAGVRFRPTSGSLTFQPGETQKTFAVELIDMPGFTGPQTVNLEIGVGQGGAVGAIGRATLTILDDEAAPQGIFRFSRSSIDVRESAGVARVTIERDGGAFDTSSISVATAGGDAVAGRDYRPIAVRLTFAPGETSKTVDIPIIDDQSFNGDRGFAVFLGFPDGNAVIGDPGVAAVAIRNDEPDPVPPAVVDARAVGFGASISTLVLGFNKPITAETALATSNYIAVAHGRDGVLGTPDDRGVPIASVARSADGRTVAVTLAAPVPAGEFVTLGVNGGPGGLADASGNLIDGNGDGVAGGSFSFTTARASRLSYRDADGDRITYFTSGGGTVEVVRGAPGTGDIVRVVDPVPFRTVLRGQVIRQRGGDGRALIRRLEGIDPFGRVRSALRTPPFVDLSQVAPAAVDSLLAGRPQARRRS